MIRINIPKFRSKNNDPRINRDSRRQPGLISNIFSNALGKFLGMVLFWSTLIIIFYFFGDKILYFLLYIVESMI